MGLTHAHVVWERLPFISDAVEREAHGIGRTVLRLGGEGFFSNNTQENGPQILLY